MQLNVLARTNFAKVYIILHLERSDSPSGSVFPDFSTFSTDAVGVGEIGNYSDIDDLIDDAAFLQVLYDCIEADVELKGQDLEVK